MNQALSEIIPLLRGAENVFIATHVFPDADALGAQLALGNILRSMGKEVYLYSEEPAHYILEFLPGSDRLNIGLPELEQFDCGVALDCGDGMRLGKEKDYILNIHPFVVIDHHTGHKNFGDFRWVDAGKSSTGEMVYELAQAMGANIDYDAAYCLYSAIVSDTGSFKYASTTADTLRIAGDLIAKGVKPAEISGKIFDNFTRNRLQLLQEVLATLALYEDEQLAVITVNREMYEKTGTTAADTELFINYPRSLEKVKVAAFIKEAKEYIGVSLRSKGLYDVSQVARMFGGGGHRNAAGFKLRDKDMAGVQKELLSELHILLISPQN
ncbi:MAG: bifunctional oligoribonuclease/PAP phosphatase NrnA [Proteobacteria bacterium]|nr:bifunctional oligoribonuclease/PAP phosphatase NrnA [Pseudomonadota bacterium]MBU4296801.1 bifunctional oligoribonuclease/PAP phosphatase NrnA [Pseudomonadota bacterium]MCG2749017.1 bifunctional oligoribonuclease/PAP phosphatase NrnA [Desulfobulbaceae bacterium]